MPLYMTRTGTLFPRTDRASVAMLFEMARRHDDYTGDNYLGSSARGASRLCGIHLYYRRGGSGVS